MEKILIVDDSEMNRAMLASILDGEYEVIEAADGEEACDVIDKYDTQISLIFLDMLMPKKNGLEVLEYMRIKKIVDAIPVIMITGETTDDTAINAYDFGADDVIYKPYVAKIVNRRALNLLEQYRHRNQIEAELQKRTIEVYESQAQIARMNSFLLSALGSVVEFRSLESGDHVKRVMTFTKILLENLKACYPKYELNSRMIDLMSQASALHDVGKIAIPDEILKAPRKLTADEFEMMKKHTTLGCEILEKFKLRDDDFYHYCYNICKWHHEKVDGKGYPDGLKNDEIPIYCQATSIADCFDALVSKRVYKEANDCETAYTMIVNGECGTFSDEILKCFEIAKPKLFEAVEKEKGAV